MSDLFFLPMPPEFSRLPWYALLLLAASVTGELFSRALHLPRVLGWISAGLVLGSSATGALDGQSLAGLRSLLDIAVGIMLFELGQRVDVKWLGRNPWLLATSLLESGFAFAAMFVVLAFVGAPPLLAAVAAAIGIATAPAVVLAVASDLRAQGQVTERMLLLTALNCIYAFLVISVLLAWLHQEYTGGWLLIVAHPIYLIFGSLALAALLAVLTVTLMAVLGPREEVQFVSVLSLIAVGVAAASVLNFSVALTLLSYGVMTRALDRQRRFAALSFGWIGRMSLMLIFAITAAGLEVKLLSAGAFTASALIAARYAGKALAVFSLAPASGMPMRKASLLALALTPMSGVALVLVRDMSQLYPQLGPALASVMVSAVVMLELLGPLVVHFALVKAGEARGATNESG